MYIQKFDSSITFDQFLWFLMLSRATKSSLPPPLTYCSTYYQGKTQPPFASSPPSELRGQPNAPARSSKQNSYTSTKQFVIQYPFLS